MSSKIPQTPITQPSAAKTPAEQVRGQARSTPQVPGSTQAPLTPIVTGTNAPATGTLQLPGTTIIPGLAKDISIGDIINFVVRGRSPDGLGLLYMFGQLVKAKIPEHLKTGDKVQAKIERQGDQLFFKILELSETASKTQTQNLAPQPQLLLSLPDRIKRDVSELLIKLAPFLPDSAHQIQAPVTELTQKVALILTSNLKDVEQIAKTLSEAIPSGQTLTDPTKLAEVLKSLTSEKTFTQLKTVFIELKEVIAKNTLPPETQFLSRVQSELSSLIELLDAKDIPKATFIEKIETLIKTLEAEVSTESLGKTATKNAKYFDSVKLILTELNTLKSQDPKEAAPQLRKVLQQLQQSFPELLQSNVKEEIPRDIARELVALSGAVEQLLNIHEMLRQLEPISKLMKSPELFLIPFLFQGILGNAEFSIDPNAHKKKEGGSRKSKEAAVSYSANIPLPNLGLVTMTSIQTAEGIEVKFNLEDNEKKAFVDSQLGDLRESLAHSGFTSAEIQTFSDTEEVNESELPEIPDVVI